MIEHLVSLNSMKMLKNSNKINMLNSLNALKINIRNKEISCQNFTERSQGFGFGLQSSV